MSKFSEQIHNFNTMYKLNHEQPMTLKEAGTRLPKFADILNEELNEVEALITLQNAAATDEDAAYNDEEALKIVEKIRKDFPNATMEQVFKVALADWLGDIIVYCASEAARYGLDIDEVLSAIMESNFSKLGEDGKPIYDARGKVCKGPHYVPPESNLYKLMYRTNEKQLELDV